MTKHTITIVMDGGLIQYIEDIPPRIEIVVKDYDIEGTLDDLETDEDGKEYIESIYGDE